MLVKSNCCQRRGNYATFVLTSRKTNFSHESRNSLSLTVVISLFFNLLAAYYYTLPKKAIRREWVTGGTSMILQEVHVVYVSPSTLLRRGSVGHIPRGFLVCFQILLPARSTIASSVGSFRISSATSTRPPPFGWLGLV